MIQDVLAVVGGDAGLVYYRLKAFAAEGKDLLTLHLDAAGGNGQMHRPGQILGQIGPQGHHRHGGQGDQELFHAVSVAAASVTVMLA